MSFVDDPKDLLEWYEKQERTLNEQFLKTIPWERIKNTEFDHSFFPILLYFRDVEKFTDVYFNELSRTPSGRDPYVRRFLEKWRHEEDLHAELLNRFLNEAGHETSASWAKESRKNISWKYTFRSFLSSLIANFVGKRFTSVHMTWGAINELTTLHGYRRLWTLTKHPVLEYILQAIAREEAIHAFFYHSFAKIQLLQSRFGRELTRVIVDRFWTPVGQGAKPEEDTNLIIKKLFDGQVGVDIMDNFITARLQLLPGFHDCQKVTQHVARVVL